MSTNVMRLTALAPLLLGAVACDVQLLPETAMYDGSGTPRLAVVVGVDAMPPGDVAAVDFALVDVLVHRERDDAWLWVAGVDARVELSLAGTSPQAAVPLHADYYDRMLVVIDAPRVAEGGAWHTAALDHDEIEIAIDVDLDADVEIELRFDVAASLSGGRGAWRFSPTVSARVVGE